MTSTAQRLEVVKAALADAGVNPEAVHLDRNGVPRWRPSMVDIETVWRAGEIGRQSSGLKNTCFACFRTATFLPDDATEERRRIRDDCQALVIFTQDCEVAR